MMRSIWKPEILLSALLLLASSLGPAVAGDQVRSVPFMPLWEKLDYARGYRGGFVERTGDTRDRVQGGLSFDEMRDNYVDNNLTGLAGISPRNTFLELLGQGPSGFGQHFVGGGRKEAVQGYQEALGEFIAGEVLLANETLLQGLRTRYPRSGDPGDASQLTLLTQSADAFFAALGVAGDAARTHPAFLRASGIVNPSFPFFVENTAPGLDAMGEPLPGELVEAEYFRLTNLLNRYGIARNALAKRKFFFGNDDDASRAEAASDFKDSAQAIYLSSALLAANQTEAEFQDNNGGELDRQITIAQQFFDDIRSGFNPLTLRGDFVPAQSTDGIFDFLEVQLQEAVCAEIAAVDAARSYDEDQTALLQELRDQTEDYLDQIDILLGFLPPFPRPGDTECAPPEQLYCDFALPEDRDLLLDVANDEKGQVSIDYLRGCDATICNNYRAWEAANIEFEAAQVAQQNIIDQMQIEEERSGTVTRIIRDGANTVSLLEFLQGIFVAATPDVTITTDKLFPLPELTWSPGAAVAGAFDARITRVEALTEIQLENTESAAILKNLMLEGVAEEVNKRRAAHAILEARAEYTASIGDLVRFLRNYAGSREELTQAYFTNPAYQVTLDRAAQNAETNFEAAMITAYKATKALEYEWAERLLNPVVDPNGPDRPIGDVSRFDDIVSAETVFAVRSAGSGGSAEPSLRTFVEALQAWDSTMREVRGPLRQEGQTRTVLLRREVFSFDSPDLAFNRIAFRSHLAARRVPGFNFLKDDLILEFPLQIYDQRILPAVPNLKIQNLTIDLRSIPGRELLEQASPNSPLISVTHDDQALIRTFFADYPEDDDFLSIDLEGARSFRQSQFFAQLEASLNGEGSAAPNTQLARRSPAVTRWVLHFEMDNGINRDLILENLDDIWIGITYAFGLPVEFDFPDILACP